MAIRPFQVPAQLIGNGHVRFEIVQRPRFSGMLAATTLCLLVTFDRRPLLEHSRGSRACRDHVPPALTIRQIRKGSHRSQTVTAICSTN